MEYIELLKNAKEASKNSYSPFSKFPVGACVLCSSGKAYTGCNVENSSFGLTICAERNAIFHAVACGEKAIEAIAIYSPKEKYCSPCGACRQVIYEFQKDKKVDVIVESDDGFEVYKINDLLPEGFRL
jgi:cytidine deaminase